MKKKILSLVLVAAMLASMLVFAPVAGASEAQAAVKVTNSAGFAGSTVSVDVVVTMDAELTTMQGIFEYDATRLTLVSAIRADWFQDGGMSATGLNNTTFKPYVNDSSICSIYASNGTEVATDGVAAFTLTFMIKEDAPAGDAFVSLFYLNEDTYIQTGTNWANALTGADQVEFFAGKITVLDGAAPVTNPADFEIVDNEDGTCTIVEYLGDATLLMIPSEINGLTVTGIGSMIFCEVNHETYKISSNSAIQGNDTVATIVVPATVKTIGEFAFMNANACTNVIVLGDALEYVSGSAFGFIGGTWYSATGGSASNRGKFKEDAWPVGTEWDDEAEDWVYTDEGYLPVGNVKLTLVNADALGADFATENGAADGNALSFTTDILGATKTANVDVTFEGVTTTYSAFGAAIKAPTFAGVVGWTGNDGNFYAPGADLGDVTAITAVVTEAPITAKVTDEFAMRFQATFTKAAYDELAALGEEVTMGMLITPRQYVIKAGNVFTMEALDALVAGTPYAGYVKVDVASAYSAIDATGAETTDFANCVAFNIAGGLTGLKDTTAAKDPDFVAIGYMQAGDVIVYSEYNASSSMRVSTFLANVNTEGLGDTELGWIDAWKSLFNK